MCDTVRLENQNGGMITYITPCAQHAAESIIFNGFAPRHYKRSGKSRLRRTFSVLVHFVETLRNGHMQCRTLPCCCNLVKHTSANSCACLVIVSLKFSSPSTNGCSRAASLTASRICRRSCNGFGPRNQVQRRGGRCSQPPSPKKSSRTRPYAFVDCPCPPQLADLCPELG